MYCTCGRSYLYTLYVHDKNEPRQNQDTESSSVKTVTGSCQKQPHRLTHTHSIHSRQGQTHAVSSPISWATSLWKIVSLIFLFTSWLWNSIYPIITPLSLTISIQIIRKNWKRTQNSIRQHFHSVKILPNISFIAFQQSSRGGCPKRKMHKRLSKLTGETLKYLDVLNDPVNEEIQRSLGDWRLSMWFAYNDTVGSFYWLHMKNTCKCIFTPIQML